MFSIVILKQKCNIENLQVIEKYPAFTVTMFFILKISYLFLLKINRPYTRQFERKRNHLCSNILVTSVLMLSCLFNRTL